MKLVIFALLLAISYAQTGVVESQATVNGIAGIALPNTDPSLGAVQPRYGYEAPDYEDIYEAQMYRQAAATGVHNYGYEYEAPDYEDMYKARMYQQGTGTATGGATATNPNTMNVNTFVSPMFYNNGAGKYGAYNNKDTLESMEEILEDIWKKDPRTYHYIITQMDTHPDAVNQMANNPQLIDYTSANANIQAALQKYPWINELLEEYPNFYDIARNFGSIYANAKMHPDIYKDMHKYETRWRYMHQQQPTQQTQGLKSVLMRRNPMWSYSPYARVSQLSRLSRPRVYAPRGYGVPIHYGRRYH